MSNSEQVVIQAPTDGQPIKILHGDYHHYQLDGANFNIESTESLITLVKTKGSKAATMIFHDDERIKVILDDQIVDRRKDVAVFGYPKSLQYEEWRRVLERGMLQKTFVDFLKLRPEGEVLDIESVLANIQHLRFATSIISEHENDGNNVTLVFKAQDAEGCTQLPKVIYANMPLINGSDLVLTMEFELEFRKPKAEDEKPVFALTCPKFARYWEEAVKHEVNKVKEGLKGYLILNGSTESR